MKVVEAPVSLFTASYLGAETIATTRTSPSLQLYRHPRYLRLSTIAAASKSVVPFKLTDIGEGIAEVELLKWFVKVVTVSMLQKNNFLLSYLISR